MMATIQKLDFDSCVDENDDLNTSYQSNQTNSSGCDVGCLDISGSNEEMGSSPPTFRQRSPCKPRFYPRLSDDQHLVWSSVENGFANNNSDSNKACLTHGCHNRPMWNASKTQNSSEISHSPPYKRVRALRLFDSPTTPKTLLEKCSSVPQTSVPVTRTRLFRSTDVTRSATAAFINQKSVRGPQANVNPFTPSGMILTSKKRTRSKRSLDGSFIDLSTSEVVHSDESDGELEQPAKRIALHDNNISRYHQEFHELSLIGTGEFGSVYKCVNRLDGCIYAIKKSRKPVAGSINEKTALNEVYAHAVLGKHEHVVRYYSAWAEDNHMIIQNEFCNGGSLADVIEENMTSGRHLPEPELKHILKHVAEGLRYIHSMQLVHMDIKPGNIFISRERRLTPINQDSADDGFEDDVAHEEEVTYKIGDLGHVTSVVNSQVEEGDCRYLPNEILHEEYSNLMKADVFSLGLTIFEAGGGGPLPKNGPLWHSIRSGELPELPHCNKEFNDLLKTMVHPDPECRPSAKQLVQKSVLCPSGNKTKQQLERELEAERVKNQMLTKQLEEASRCLKTIITAPLSDPRANRLSRLVGKKTNRSHSLTNF